MTFTKSNQILLILALIFIWQISALAEVNEEFKIKREAIFTFSTKPSITVKDKIYTITFETKGFCDVTISVEDQNRKIFRHLASGVLGKNAPEPFQKNSKKQKLIWDGKDDAGRYVTNIEELQIRVSLGLKPKLERSLQWSPHKRTTAWSGARAQNIAITKEGVYVYQKSVFDHLRMFDHQGNYKKTIYPFSFKAANNVKGLPTHKFAHDDKTLPLKKGYYQTSLLHGKSTPLNVNRKNVVSLNAHGLVVHKNDIILLGKRAIRFTTNGASQTYDMEGPEVGKTFVAHGGNADRKTHNVLPSSGAISPDGKTLYVTGHLFRHLWHFDTLHGVGKVDLTKNEKMTTFAGTFKQDKKGNSNNEFSNAVSVACDSKGRVYVADHMNNRIQVYSPQAKFLKSIKVYRPAHINIHPKTDELYIFSWHVHNRTVFRSKKKEERKPVKATLSHYGSFDSPNKKAIWDLPLPIDNLKQPEWANHLRGSGSYYVAQMNFFTKEPTVWLSQGKWKSWSKNNIQILGFKNKKFVVLKDFANDVKKAGVRQEPAQINRQRLYVNPKTGNLYVAEADGGVGKSMKQLLRINPNTGKSETINLPYDSEDLCFDQDGLIYLRTGKEVGRYDLNSWKEVPWDYGVERSKVTFESGSNARAANLISAMTPPGHRAYSWWHLGGMAISAKGNLVIHTAGGANATTAKPSLHAKRKYKAAEENEDLNQLGAKMYPGRYLWGLMYVYDKHGNFVVKDAAPGVGMVDGLFIDSKDNIYTMVSGRRLFKGKSYDAKLTDDLSETIVKFKAGKIKFLSKDAKTVKLSPSSYPKRPPEIQGGTMGGNIWAEGAQWLYGGVGFAGKNGSWSGGGCCCWNSRFVLDYFARSFVPELRHFSVAVLDTNGNLILRIGRYGNVDEGKPIIQAGGPKNTTSIGGDEVSLFHGAYLATDTDKRLFIADDGNSRILSVKLDYHTNEIIKLSK
ncbi:MAG: hypothetical protein COA79_19675 [Planctomycetota bacterium]|nr:MAG: hypothetical protein COA79_19675 [Planctomycetota bacterium]